MILSLQEKDTKWQIGKKNKTWLYVVLRGTSHPQEDTETEGERVENDIPSRSRASKQAEVAILISAKVTWLILKVEMQSLLSPQCFKGSTWVVREVLGDAITRPDSAIGTVGLCLCPLKAKENKAGTPQSQLFHAMIPRFTCRNP